MPVLFLIAIVVVLVGIFFAATGRGGEMAYEPADHAPLDLGPVSAADIALLRPPTAMWGYNMQVTDEALDQIARAVRERDITIAYLQDQLAGYEHNGSYPGPLGAYAGQDPEISAAEPYGTREIPEPFGPGPSAFAATAPQVIGLAELFESRDTPEASGASPETPSASPGAFGASPEAFGASPENPGASHEAPEAFGASPENPGASPEAPGASPEAPGAPEPHDALESQEAHQSLEDPEASHSSEPGESPATPDPVEPPEQPRTPLVLKASAPKPEPHEPTQPSQILPDPGDAPDATEPSAVPGDDEESGEATQPSAAVAPDEPKGPQGAFDTHGWWAEQQEAARHDQPHRPASGKQEGDSMAAAEEQGW